MKFIAFLFVFLLSAKADESLTIEPPDSRVNVLSYNNFDRFIQRNELILMEFYAPWCGHCQQLAAPYREAAEQLENLDLPRKVKLAKYNDGDEYNRQLRAGAPDMYNYTSYPSLFVFDKGEHTPYYGGRTAEDIVFYMTAVAKGLDPHEEELKTKPGLYKDKPEFSKWVTDFQDEELFEEQIWKNSENKLRVVEYYSDRCPFCQSLAKEYVEAASIVTEKFPGKVQFHGVNSRIFYDIAETQGITGYPWVSFYYKGEKVEDMAGLGGADSIVNWVSKNIEQHYDEDWVSPFPPEKGLGGSANALEAGGDENEGECGMPDYETLDKEKLQELVGQMDQTLEAIKKLLA